MKPPKTISNDLNKSEMDLFKQRRRFDNWKDKAHYYFDIIWRDAKIMTREEAYKWLANKLNVKNAHFSNLDDMQCEKAIWFSQQLLNDNRRMDLDFGMKPITPFYIL